MSVEEYFATGPPHERPVFDAVLAYFAEVGPVHVEPVSVGIFLTRARTFGLPRRVTHRRITRKPIQYGARWWHVANVGDPGDLDPELLGFLEEAYAATPE